MPDLLSKLSRLMSRVTLVLSAIGLCAMTLVITWQVFARYVLNASPSWSEQASLLLMIWFIFLATAVGIREGFHIRITALTDSLGTKLEGAAAMLAHVIVGLIGVGMLVWGVELALYTLPHSIPTLGVTRAVAYAPLVISGAMITFFALEHIVAQLQGREVEPLWNW